MSFDFISLAIYCWALGLALKVVCIPSEAALEELIFLFAHGYQLDIASVLRIGACVHSSSQHWDPVCADTGHAATVSLSSSVLFCVEGLVSLAFSIPSGSSNLSTSSSAGFCVP